MCGEQKKECCFSTLFLTNWLLRGQLPCRKCLLNNSGFIVAELWHPAVIGKCRRFSCSQKLSFKPLCWYMVQWSYKFCTVDLFKIYANLRSVTLCLFLKVWLDVSKLLQIWLSPKCVIFLCSWVLNRPRLWQSKLRWKRRWYSLKSKQWLPDIRRPWKSESASCSGRYVPNTCALYIWYWKHSLTCTLGRNTTIHGELIVF